MRWDTIIGTVISTKTNETTTIKTITATEFFSSRKKKIRFVPKNFQNSFHISCLLYIFFSFYLQPILSMSSQQRQYTAAFDKRNDDPASVSMASNTTAANTITSNNNEKIISLAHIIKTKEDSATKERALKSEKGQDDEDNNNIIYGTNKNMGRIKIRREELTKHSSRYERTIAAPSDQFLIAMWYLWTVITWMVGIFTFIVFCGILSSRRCRRNVFNLYLLFLMFPDILFSLLCGATCLLNAIHGYYWTFGSQHDHHHDMMMDDVDTANNNFMCNFQQWYVTFGVGANAWLNAVITRQLHYMLRYSSKGRRYHPPSRRDVKLQSISIYLYVAFLGTWGLTLTRNPSSTVSNIFNKFPMSSGSYSGLACLPIEPDSTGGALFFWLIFFPLFVGIPVIYVFYVAWDVYHQNLLPPTGKRVTWDDPGHRRCRRRTEKHKSRCPW